MASVTDTSNTLASLAYARLRTDILSGTMPPGRRLHIRDLCGQLGIGLSPVREALNRLSAQGLVLQSDQRGFTVAPVNLDDLGDLTLARVALNEAALRDSVAHGDAAWEEAVLVAHYRLARTPLGDGAVCPAWEARHREFHLALLAACRSGRIRLYCEQLFDMADRYRLVSRAVGAGARDVRGEHEAIMHAVLARDADRAVALLDAHVRQTEALVREAMLQALPAAGGVTGQGAGHG
jgi:GntR family carbon starvation induced transcriptional regulator